MKRIFHVHELTTVLAVAGERGGVHFHVRPAKPDCCGIETHLEVESGEKCWLLDAPCEHDGSTIVGRERWLPIFNACNATGDFNPLFAALEAYCTELYGIE